MTAPQVKQVRELIQVAGGDRKWRVTTIVTDPGDLPFAELFVVTIADASDPKQDVYTRVAEPLEFRQTVAGSGIYVKVRADDMVTIAGDPFARVSSPNELTSTPRDRVVAVRTGKTEYLTSAITLLYDTLTSADAAYRQLLDRLSTLVTDWPTASGAFVTTPYALYALPVVSDAEETRRATAWRAARAARVTAETARDAASAASAACETQGEGDERYYNELVADVAFLQAAHDRVSVMTETGSTNAKTFALNASDAGSWEALLAQKRNKLATALAAVQTHEQQCADLRRAELQAQAAVDAARTTENAALASVLAICPTFDSSQP